MEDHQRILLCDKIAKGQPATVVLLVPAGQLADIQ
jgi:hypothetical protein